MLRPLWDSALSLSRACQWTWTLGRIMSCLLLAKFSPLGSNAQMRQSTRGRERISPQSSIFLLCQNTAFVDTNKLSTLLVRFLCKLNEYFDCGCMFQFPSFFFFFNFLFSQLWYSTYFASFSTTGQPNFGCLNFLLTTTNILIFIIIRELLLTQSVSFKHQSN